MKGFLALEPTNTLAHPIISALMGRQDCLEPCPHFHALSSVSSIRTWPVARWRYISVCCVVLCVCVCVCGVFVLASHPSRALVSFVSLAPVITAAGRWVLSSRTTA
jgi:hypothetical protein